MRAAVLCACALVCRPILHGDVTLRAKMYCDDWEEGANRIALREHKWLLQQDLHIQVYVLVSYRCVSLVGVVTCVRKERYDLAPFSQYISAPPSPLQHGGSHTEAYERDVTVQTYSDNNILLGLRWLCSESRLFQFLNLAAIILKKLVL